MLQLLCAPKLMLRLHAEQGATFTVGEVAAQALDPTVTLSCWVIPLAGNCRLGMLKVPVPTTVCEASRVFDGNKYTLNSALVLTFA